MRVTTDAGGDFNPSLMQDEQGIFHLAWFRWTAPFRGHILSNSSPDGLTWDPRKEVPVTTTDGVDDWVPTLTQAADGTLLIEALTNQRAATGLRGDLVHGDGPTARRALLPRPGAAVVDLGHLPHQLGLRVLYLASVNADQASLIRRVRVLLAVRAVDVVALDDRRAVNDGLAEVVTPHQLAGPDLQRMQPAVGPVPDAPLAPALHLIPGRRDGGSDHWVP